MTAHGVGALAFIVILLLILLFGLIEKATSCGNTTKGAVSALLNS